jgi:hypothetical protein
VLGCRVPLLATADGSVSKERIEQRRLTHRGRQFHFVSYEGLPANPARLQPATGPAWYLMSAGKRWAVMPHEPALESADVDRLLIEWLDTHVFA